MEMAKIKIRQNCVLYLTEDPTRGNNIMPGEEKEIDLHMPILRGQEHKFDIIDKPEKKEKEMEKEAEKKEPEKEPVKEPEKDLKVGDTKESGPARNFRRKGQ